MANGAMQRRQDVFEFQKKQIEQTSRAREQEAQSALKRKFAAAGMLSSGSAIKQGEILRQRAAEEREKSLQSVNLAQAEAEERKEERKKEMEFAASEALKQRKFAGIEAEKQRTFTGEQSDMDRAFREKVFQFDRESKLAQIDMTREQLELEKDAQAFNKALGLADLDDIDAFRSAMSALAGPRPRPTAQINRSR